MCGSPLPAATPKTAEPVRPEPIRSQPAPPVVQPTTVNGPSFLGLATPASEPEPQPQYLFEDAQDATHPMAYVALLLVLVIGGTFVWIWAQQGPAWHTIVGFMRRGQNSAPVAVNQPPQTPTAATPAPSEAPSPLPTEAAAEPAKTETTMDLNPASAKPSVQPERTIKETQSADEGRTPAEAVHPASEEDKLVTDGKNYLYGNGVQKNCDLARSKLFVAAEQNNAEAQSVLGAMFATGHCVATDLPTAYHWLAKAESQTPNNPRLTANLRMVWREMSPSEQQAAVRQR